MRKRTITIGEWIKERKNYDEKEKKQRILPILGQAYVFKYKHGSSANVLYIEPFFIFYMKQKFYYHLMYRYRVPRMHFENVSFEVKR